MYRLILLACLIPGLAVVASAQDVDPMRFPVVKRALDKAEATILRNRKAYDEANEKALAEAEEKLLKEVDRLSKAGKPEEAVAVKTLATGFRDWVVASAEKKVAPPNPFQEGAVAWNGHKYKYFPEALAWHDAKKKCEEMGGYLVIIDGLDEHAFLVKALKPLGLTRIDVAIGVTCEGKRGDWRTVKGDPLKYETWLTGEPNNLHGGEDCVRASFQFDGNQVDGRWYDSSPKTRTAFICEWDE